MKKEMKVSPFFDREYLKRAETREDREKLLQNIEWVSMDPAEEFLANLANIWLRDGRYLHGKRRLSYNI